MKLHELQTVDDELPFDFEVALRALANGRSLYLHDVFFQEKPLKVRHIKMDRARDIYSFNVFDPDSTGGYRDATYGMQHVSQMKLGENEIGALVLTVPVVT